MRRFGGGWPKMASSPGARTCGAFRAQCMRELIDVHYPDAECIRVVQDNLSTHSGGALYQAFPPAEARRILRRLEFHYTPKHASWLNMVEIEIGVLRGQRLDRRIDDPKRLRREIAAWEQQRNAARARIKWMSTTDKAREMPPAFPYSAGRILASRISKSRSLARQTTRQSDSWSWLWWRQSRLPS
jgi:hypothetical protein